MYDDEILRVPTDEAELWTVLREQFAYARHVLYELPIETKDEALSIEDPREAKRKRHTMGAIRYRGTSEEQDQRDYCLERGRELLPYIDQALDEEKLTPEFVQQWGKLMFYHGFIASYVFDDSDDLETHRNRVKGTRAMDRTPQRVFLARLLLWFMDEQKQRRKQAEPNAAKAIWDFIEAGNAEGIPGGYDLAWFRTLVRDADHELIVSSMEQKNMSEASLRELAAAEFDDLPPIELVLPTVQP